MRRVLLLGMAALLGMVASPSYGQERETIFTNFGITNRWSEFSQDNSGRGYENEGWQTVQNREGLCGTTSYSYTDDYGVSGETWLISPTLDISNKRDLQLLISHCYSYENPYGGMVSYLNTVMSIMVKIDDGDWTQMKIDEYFQKTSSSSWDTQTTTIDFSSVIGNSFQFAFRINTTNSNKMEWFVSYCTLTGIAASEAMEIIDVPNFHELSNLNNNEIVRLELDSVLCYVEAGNKVFFNDGTGCLIIDYYNSDQCRYRYVKGTIIGRYTNETGLPELKSLRGDLTLCIYEDDGMDYYEEYKIVSTSDYWDNIGNLVEIDIDHEDFIVEDLYGLHWVYYSSPNNIITKINASNFHVRVNGIAYPTPEGKPRIVLTRSLNTMITYLPDDITSYPEIPYTTVTVERQLKKGQWNTLCLPFEFGYYNGTCATFVSGNDGVLSFKTTTSSISAGQPFLFKPNYDYQSVSKSGFHLKAISPKTKNGGEYKFVGTLTPVHPQDGSYYLTANNTIKPLASGGTINAFRAYFEPTSTYSAQARAISIDGMTTAIEDIVGGEELLGIPQKVYTVNGQYAGDDLEDLPKGVYIVNGKKIIK